MGDIGTTMRSSRIDRAALLYLVISGVVVSGDRFWQATRAMTTWHAGVLIIAYGLTFAGLAWIILFRLLFHPERYDNRGHVVRNYRSKAMWAGFVLLLLMVNILLYRALVSSQASSEGSSRP